MSQLFSDTQSLVWKLFGMISTLLFFFAAVVIILLVRQKRYRALWAAVPALIMSYFMTQCFIMALEKSFNTQFSLRLINRFSALPNALHIIVCLAMAAVLGLLFWDILRREHGSITTMSVKEAVDSLPVGLCCYAAGGRVLLANHMMEELCLRATGEVLRSGEELFARMQTGDLAPGCRSVTVGSEPITLLADGTAWKIDAQEIPYEQHRVKLLLAADITEAYRKTEELRGMQRRVTAMNRSLAKVNSEIVSLTVEREVLSAKVKLHDELGSNLLAMKHYCLAGGTEAELAEIKQRLRRGVTLLKTDSPASVRDEYELILEMAERLGVTISFEGALPQTEPQKHVVAVAMHECMTNALRHAHGDELRVCVTEDAEKYTVRFSNNGEPPAGEVEERGGLASLRDLTEHAGGTMTICSAPLLTIELELPKEDKNGV